MTIAQRTQSAIDLKPWAAYVVGHHPHSIGMRLDVTWERIRERYPESHSHVFEEIDPEIEEVDRALRELAGAGRVLPRPLLDFSHAWEWFFRDYRKFAEEVGIAEAVDASFPGCDAMAELRTLQAAFVHDSNELRHWLEIGVAVGRTQHLLGTATGWCMDRIIAPLPSCPG